MCRRRFFKSYFYIDYNGVKYQNGETVPVSPFPAAGGSVTITLVAARPWQITNNTWLSISSIQDKSGTYTITLTASANESYSSRSGSFTANTLDERNRIVVSFSQEPQASEKYLTVSPNPLNLGAEDSGTLVCYLHYNGTVSIVTPTWSESSSVIQIDANGGVTSNNTDPSPVNNIPVTATYVHEGDTLTTTSTVNVGAASIEYRNLYVSPSAMTLGKGDEKGIQAFVEEYVNGHHTRDMEVTLESTWTSADDSIADVSRSGNNEVVTPVYGQGYFPDTRNTTVTATYQGMTASCDVTVEPEGYIEYEIEVSPIRWTLGYGETYNNVIVTYYVVTDGVRDDGTDVTTNANTSYSPDNSATTVSVGANAVTLTGNNTGTSNQDTYITVSYPGCDSKNMVITNLPAVRDKRLVVTPDPATINADGTSQMSAVYEEWIGSTKVVSIELNPENVTWSITIGNEYATIDVSGEVQGTNETYETQVVTVRGYYGEKDVEDTADITVRAADIPYNPNIVWLNDEIDLPAYWTEGGSSNESFEFVDIDPSTIGIEVISGESLDVYNLYVGTSDGSCDVAPTSFNHETERLFIGTVRVSGLGLDGTICYDDLDVYQEAGVETYLLIEHEAEHTDARSDIAGASLIYTIQFSGIEEGSLAISGYEGNISDAYIRVDGESMSVTLDSNTALTQVTSDLYIIAMTVYGDEISAHLIITQPAYVPTCSLVWDVNTFCGDTKCITVAAYRSGNYEQDDLIETIGYVPQNVSNISLSIISDTDGMIDNGTLAGNNRAQYVIYVNPLNTERYAIVRVEGDGADGNTHHDDLIIFQRYVEPDLLVNGDAIHEVTVTSAFTGNDYTLAWHYADPDSVGIVSYNGFITSCTMGQKTTGGDDGECDITVEVAPNTGSSVFENVVIFTGTSVLGLPMTAELHIYQEQQDVPLITLTWNYSVHFIGRPPQNNFSIRFDLYNGNDEKIWDNDLIESSYDDSQVDQTFSDTATFSVPASTSFAGLYAENSPAYTGQYWETVSKVGNVITTELVVPSVEPIELDIHVQAFSDAATGSFPFEITLQSLSYEDQTPVSDAWITQATTEAGSTMIDILANTGNTTPATLAFQDFRTRMGYWLGIHVDNQDTGTYSDIAVVIEDGTHQLDELQVMGSEGAYMVFVGGEDYDWDNGDLFIKLIDNTQPSCNFELTYPGSTAISFNADPTFYLDYDGNLDDDTIGLYNKSGDAFINEITIEDVTPTRKKVIVDLEPNCSTSDKLLLFTLSARCGSTMVTATSDQVMQSHSQGYSVTVNEQRGFFVMVQNRLNYDIKLNSFQVYVRNDCQESSNVFQYPAPALTIPANSSVNASDIKTEGQYVRPNDTYAWANVSLSDVQNGTNVQVSVGGYTDNLTYSGTNLEARFPLTRLLTLNDSSFILVIG